MKLNELRPAPGSVRKVKRLGRGTGSGHGKTAGKGTKGQRARSGGKKAPWFEGGQTPLVRRIPKLPGFKNPFKKDYEIVNVSSLDSFEDGSIVTVELLLEKRIIRKKGKMIKILGNGELKKKLTVQANAFTQTAIQKIEANSGQAEIVR